MDAYFEIAGGERARRRASREVDPEAAATRAATRAQHEEAFERLRESLRPYAPFHVSQLHFDGFAADETPEHDGERGDKP